MSDYNDFSTILGKYIGPALLSDMVLAARTGGIPDGWLSVEDIVDKVDLSGLAEDDHTHSNDASIGGPYTLYSTFNSHAHTGVYSPVGHSHVNDHVIGGPYSLATHDHDTEYAPLSGRLELDIFLSRTGTDGVGNPISLTNVKTPLVALGSRHDYGMFLLAFNGVGFYVHDTGHSSAAIYGFTSGGDNLISIPALWDSSSYVYSFCVLGRA